MKQFTIGRVGLVLLATASVCLGQAAVASASGGNSANAKLCQKGGWQTLVRSDGSTFTNEEACVSYAAGGGTLDKESQAQINCQSFGGTYSTDPATNKTGQTSGTFAWSCNGFTDDSSFDHFQTLSSDCGSNFDRFSFDALSLSGVYGSGPIASTCSH